MIRFQHQPVLETRLATLVLGELVRREIDDTQVDIVLEDLEAEDLDPPYYAAFELVFASAVTPDIATTELRDTTYDHVETVEFPKLEHAPAPVPQASAPYARVEVGSPTLPLPMTSVPFERVDLHDLRAFVRRDPTEVIDARVPRSQLVTVMVSIVVLAAALGLGLGLVLLVT